MSTLLKNVEQHKYQDRGCFMSDLVLIRDNFVAFERPGPENNRAAHEIVTICKNTFDNLTSNLEEVERLIIAEKNTNCVW